ncbi:MAG: adenylate/guanylate cyclase domain-containing protein [Candidatus Ozemobacteraceae bacterium]
MTRKMLHPHPPERAIFFNGRISPWILLGIWLFAFVIPVFLLRFSLDELIARDEMLRLERGKKRLLGEMYTFRRELETEHFTKKCFENVQETALNVSEKNQSTEALFQTLYDSTRREIGCVPELLILWTRENNRLRYFLKSRYLPGLREMGGEKNLETIIAAHTSWDFDNLQEKSRLYQRGQTGVGLFKKLFGTFGDEILRAKFNDNPSLLVSGREIYPVRGCWMRGPSNRPEMNWISLTVVREDLLPMRRMCQVAVARENSNDIRRSLLRSSRFSGPSFVSGRRGMFYLDVLPAHLQQGFAKGNSGGASIISDPPRCLAVEIPGVLLNSPLRVWRDGIGIAAIFLAACAGILFLRWGLLGGGFALNAAGKIILGMLLVLWIPVVGISMIGFSLHEFQEWLRGQDALDEIEGANRLIERGLTNVDQLYTLNIAKIRDRCESLMREGGARAATKLHRVLPRERVGKIAPNILVMTDDEQTSNCIRGESTKKNLQKESKDVLLKMGRGIMLELFLRCGGLEKLAADPARMVSAQRTIALARSLGDFLLSPGDIDEYLAFPCETKPLVLSAAIERATLFAIRHDPRETKPPRGFIFLNYLFLGTYNPLLSSLHRRPGGPFDENGNVHDRRVFGIFTASKDDTALGTVMACPPDKKHFSDLYRSAERGWFDKLDLRLEESAASFSRVVHTWRYPGRPFILSTHESLAETTPFWKSNLKLLGSLAAVFGCIALAVAASLLRPIRATSEAVRLTAAGRFDWRLELGGKDEMAEMASALNQMIEGVRRRERLKRFVSEDVLAAVASDDEQLLTPGGERCEATILFSDIRSFTTLSTKYPPETVVSLLNAYFTRMEGCIRVHGGILDKFIGDALMAIFREEKEAVSPSDHAKRAARAALAMREELATFNREREAAGLITIQTGIGLASGSVISGRIGSSAGRGRLDFTVVGETVNRAAALEAASKGSRKTGIIISDATRLLLLSGKDSPGFRFEKFLNPARSSDKEKDAMAVRSEGASEVPLPEGKAEEIFELLGEEGLS